MSGATAARPTRAELAAAADRLVPDVLAPGLRVLFCGINPGLYSGWMGRHFARPGTRFWKALHQSGFSDRLLHPSEDGLLPTYGCGLTNLVPRTTARADELAPDELRAGRLRLEAIIRAYRPYILAVLGVGAYRTAFEQPQAGLGLQSGHIDDTRIWVLPNPSGLNAHYTLADLAGLFREMWEFAWEGMRVPAPVDDDAAGDLIDLLAR